MTSTAAVITRSSSRRIAVGTLLWSLLILPRWTGYAQTNGVKVEPLILPLPLSVEWSESLNPWAQSKLVTDRFKLLAGTKNVKLQFSDQAPDFLSGKQFQGFPGGYQLTEFSLSRKWGAVHGFRSLRYNSRLVSPEFARTITGAGVETPKAVFGTRLSAYFLQATPTSQARRSNSNSLAGSDGSQIGVTVVRELRKGTTLQAEWVQARYALLSSGNRNGLARGAHRGLLVRLDGSLARTDFNFAYVARDEGLADPAAPVYGPAQRGFRLDVSRKMKRHHFQYGGQSNSQGAAPALGWVVRDVSENSLRWTYVHPRLPQISASQGWSRLTVAGRREEEKTFRLSLDKSLRRLHASLAYLRGVRADAGSALLLWERAVLSGDATIEIRPNRSLHMRYETSGLRQHMLLQVVSTSSLQFDTRMNVGGDKLSLAPAFDLRRQEGSSPALGLTAARILLCTMVKLPRRIPGTDFLINFAFNHVSSSGYASWNHAELTMRWSFKRF